MIEVKMVELVMVPRFTNVLNKKEERGEEKEAPPQKKLGILPLHPLYNPDWKQETVNGHIVVC